MISIITPTFNEEKNIKNLIYSVKKQLSILKYDYEHIIIDNSSTDNTQSLLKKFVRRKKMLKLFLI